MNRLTVDDNIQFRISLITHAGSRL